MNEIQISLAEECPDRECDSVVRGLIGYNNSRAPIENYQGLSVLACRQGEVLGGLVGYTHWGWLFIKQLWVAAPFRRHGLGKRLVLVAEREARDRGCLHAHCDTFDFQALPFYQALGYSIFGQLDDYPAGHSRFFLQKRNLHEPGKG